MILSATKIQGYNYTATPTLATIGKLITWYDYRRGLASQDFSGTERALSLADLSDNNFQLNSVGVSNNTRRPIVYADGLGNIANITSFKSTALNDNVNKFHNGSPYLIFSVISLNDTVGTQVDICGTTLSGQPGISLRIAASTRVLACLTQNDAGDNIGAQNTPTNSIPLDEFILVQRLYYGSGTGSNNVKTYIKDTLYENTFNPTFGTGQASDMRWLTTIGNVEFKGKMMASWDLTGKTPAECDAFRTLAVNTLKSDLEYSSLTTA